MPKATNPKRTAFSGSALLGRELKRLRGRRKLSDIADMSRAAPLRRYAAPLAEATLSEIENGKTMPSLATMHALSLVYRTSMTHLMSHVVEERLAKDDGGSATTLAEAESSLAEHLARGEWYAALALAHEWEARATLPEHRLAWRANRAACLSRIGLHDEAIVMLAECVESEFAVLPRKLWMLAALADAQLAAGHEYLASLSLREADALAQRVGVDTPQRARLLLLRASALVQCRDADAERGGVAREALRTLDAAERDWPPSDGLGKLRLRLVRAQAFQLDGNGLMACKEARIVLADPQATACQHLQAQACCVLGVILRSRSERDEARALLGRAATLARAGELADIEFAANLELFEDLRADRPGTATRCLERCRQLYPLLSARTQAVRRFERLTEALS